MTPAPDNLPPLSRQIDPKEIGLTLEPDEALRKRIAAIDLRHALAERSVRLISEIERRREKERQT